MILKELPHVLPVLICGRKDLLFLDENRDIFKEEIVDKLNYSLSKWIEIHRNTRRSIRENLKGLSTILLVGNLMPFIIIDEAHLIGDIGELMERLRSFESDLKFAGVMLLFQDLSQEQREKINSAIHGRGGSRFRLRELSTKDFLPAGDELEKIEQWVFSILKDKVAAKVYTRIAADFGFRAANMFGHVYVNPVGRGDLKKVSAAIVRALSEKYKLPAERHISTDSSTARADLYLGDNRYLDVKVCTDTQSLIRAIKEDKAKGFNPIYIVVGNCDVPAQEAKAYQVRANIDPIARAVGAVAINIGVNEDELYGLLGKIIAESIDFEKIGLQKPSQEELIIKWATDLCKEIRKSREGLTFSQLIKKPLAKSLATTLGITLSRADDALKLIQELQSYHQCYRLPFRFSRYGRRVKCETTQEIL